MGTQRKRITRKEFVRHAGLVAGAAALGACAPATPQVIETEKIVEKPVPQTVVVEKEVVVTPTPKPMKPTLAEVRLGNGETHLVTTLDPYDHWAFSQYEFQKLVYDHLVERDVTTGKFEPSLATKWTTVDPNTVKFELRKGVKFHNGEEFTGESVKMSLERFIQETLPMQGYRWTQLDSVEVHDKYAVTVKLKEPLGTLFSSLAVTPMLSPKARQDGGEKWLDDTAVGTGPFQFDEWSRPDGRFSVVRNPEYWGGPEYLRSRLGNCEKFTFIGIPEVGSRVSALLAKDIQIAGWLTPETIGMVTRDPDLQVRSYVGADQAYLGFNLNQEPLGERKVRYAMSLAIDRQKITELISPVGQVAAGYIPPGVMGYNPNLKPDPYDVDRAKALLKEAGYGDGFSFEMHYKPGPWPKIAENMQMLHEYWKQIGIDCKVLEDESSLFLKVRTEGTYGIYVSQYGNLPMDPAEHLGARVMNDPFKGGFPEKDPEITQLLREAQSMLDQQKREEAYKKIDEMLIDQGRGPWIVQFYPGYLYAFGHGVAGFEMSPNSIHDYRTLMIATA